MYVLFVYTCQAIHIILVHYITDFFVVFDLIFFLVASIVCQISVIDFHHFCHVPLLIYLVSVLYCLITAIDNRVFFIGLFI